MSAQLNDFELEEFKKLVQQWISYDDDIRKLKEAEKKINEAKKALTEPILQFMSKNSIEDCNTSTGKLKYCVSLHKKPMSKQFLVDKLTIYLNNGKKSEEITNYLLENREVEQKVNLRRAIPKRKLEL